MALETVYLRSASGAYIPVASDYVSSSYIPITKLDLGGDGVSSPVSTYIPVGLIDVAYTEGQSDASITGIPILWEDTSNIVRTVRRAVNAGLPVDVTAAPWAQPPDFPAYGTRLLVVGNDTFGKFVGAYGTDVPLPVYQSNAATEATLQAISTSDSNVSAAVVATSAASTGTDKGMVGLAIRDDVLTTLGAADADFTPQRVDERGATWVQLAGAISAYIDSISIGSRAGQGMTKDMNLDVDETEDAVKATGGTLLGYYIANLHASSWRYVKFYNATTANVTVGSTTPYLTLPIPAGSAAHIWLGEGVLFDTAITVAATTGVLSSDSGAPGTNEVVVNSFFK